MVSADTLPGAAAGPEAAFKPNSSISPAFRSRAYVIAERRLRVRLEEGFDTVLLVGETGTGKSTLLAAIAAELAWSHPIIHFGQSPLGGPDALDCWREIAAAGESGRVVAIIDDADLLPIELQVAAHEARRSEAGPRVQFIFGITPSAFGRFSSAAADLDEAMACCTLGRLDDDEVPEFVRHRLAACGADPAHFTREALAHVALCAQGVPRLVNLICAKACFLGSMNNEARVSASSVEEAAFVLRLGNISIDRLTEDSATSLNAA
jgi:energy-coupling factor transporter ATP-binding protein EcfA2